MEKIDIRGTAAQLTAAINQMCNAKDSDTVAHEFINCKDLLISLYQANIQRCGA